MWGYARSSESSLSIFSGDNSLEKSAEKIEVEEGAACPRQV